MQPVKHYAVMYSTTTGEFSVMPQGAAVVHCMDAAMRQRTPEPFMITTASSEESARNRCGLLNAEHKRRREFLESARASV